MSFPLPVEQTFGDLGTFLLYLVIGFAFGFVLEISGFAKSTRLAAQFYFKDLAVLKVMFGAIVVAMTLIFLTSALGILDYNLLWVNPTYMVPGIVGGLLMGVGFILGGFCPGTSLVSAVTLKIDGIVFLLGALFGIFAFGETVGLFEQFWHSTYMGRFTLPELFGVETGVVVFAIVIMALLAFAAAEWAEKAIGKKEQAEPKWRFAIAGGLVLLSGAVMLIGQPTNAQRWEQMRAEKESLITERKIQVEIGEMLQLLQNRRLIVYMIDVRKESDFNAFHLRDARNVPFERLLDERSVLQNQPDNTVFILMSNDETLATEAWKVLTAENVQNLYILAGGINAWIETFAEEDFLAASRIANRQDEQLGFFFPAALGSRHPFAAPNPANYTFEFTKKVELQAKRGGTGGGCG